MTGNSSHSRVHTVFFDVGGTLVDNPDFFQFMADELYAPEPVSAASFLRRQFKEHTRDPNAPFREIKAMLADAFRALAAATGIPVEQGDAARLYRKLFMEVATLFDDVRPVLEELQLRAITLHIISNADADLLYDELERFGIRHAFQQFVVSSEVRAYKPSDKIVAAGRHLCRDPLEGIVYVGDENADLTVARKMGVRGALVRRSDTSTSEADLVLDSLYDLLPML
jgi:2-haloalkanoic acid dehalogenase type II